MMTRRDLIVAVISAAATSTGFLMPWKRVGDWMIPARDPIGLGHEMAQFIAQLDNVSHVGRAFVEQSNPSVELEDLAKRFSERLGPLPTEANALQLRIASAIRADFRERRICQIEGWQLSQTECELAGMRWLAFGDRSVQKAVAQVGDDPVADQGPPPILATVTAWGPQTTEEGMKFNPQPDGHSGLWFLAQDVPTWAKMRIDGVEMPTQITEKGFTSGLFGDVQERILATPGRYLVELYDPMKKVAQPIGEFVVRPRAERVLRPDGSRSEVFCPVTDWGARETVAGIAANPQPDGSMGLWFKLDCAPQTLQVAFGDDRLNATVSDTLVTTRVPLALLESARDVPITLRDPGTGEELAVGTFHILAP